MLNSLDQYMITIKRCEVKLVILGPHLHSSQLRLIPYLHHIEEEKRTHPRFADWPHLIS